MAQHFIYVYPADSDAEVDGERYDAEGKIGIPAERIVCPRCDGEGTMDHPAFAGGFTQSEMDEYGPEFMDDYFRGTYDVRCEECHGDRVTLQAVDEERMTPTQRAAWKGHVAYLFELAFERKMREMGRAW